MGQKESGKKEGRRRREGEKAEESAAPIPYPNPRRPLHSQPVPARPFRPRSDPSTQSLFTGWWLRTCRFFLVKWIKFARLFWFGRYSITLITHLHYHPLNRRQSFLKFSELLKGPKVTVFKRVRLRFCGWVRLGWESIESKMALLFVRN